MKLIYAHPSPFVRKVMVLLHETNQIEDVDLQTVATTPVATADEVKSANPLGKIPTLLRDDGPALYDSRVICAYLNDRSDGGLYGGGWDSQVLEATADGMMDAAVLAAYERRLRPADKQWDDWEAAQLGKVLAGCATLNARWMSHLKGPLDIGQIAVACALSYIDLRHPECNWRHGNEALADWFADFESRPSMVATKDPVT